MTLTCLRCLKSWEAESPKPRVCAKCRTAYWDIPRKWVHPNPKMANLRKEEKKRRKEMDNLNTIANRQFISAMFKDAKLNVPTFRFLTEGVPKGVPK